MRLFGIPLTRPGFNRLTSAAVMAVGLWVLAVGMAHLLGLALTRADAGALLVVIAWGCVSVQLGIRIEQGRRHLLANVFVSALLLAVYQGAWALAA